MIVNVSDAKKQLVEKGKNAYFLLLAKADVEDGCFMRMFILEPGGYLPKHRHNKIYHLQYVLEGKLKVRIDDKEYILKKGDSIFVDGRCWHEYINISDSTSKFLCITPNIQDEMIYYEDT